MKNLRLSLVVAAMMSMSLFAGDNENKDITACDEGWTDAVIQGSTHMIHSEIAFFPMAFAAYGSSKLVRGILSKTKSMSDVYPMMSAVEGLLVPAVGAAPIVLTGLGLRSIAVAEYHANLEKQKNPQPNVNKKIEAAKLFTTAHLACQGGSKVLGVPLFVSALPCLALQGAFIAAAKAAQKQ